MQIDKEYCDELKRLYKEGNSIKVIADWSGLTKWTVASILGVSLL